MFECEVPRLLPEMTFHDLQSVHQWFCLIFPRITPRTALKGCERLWRVDGLGQLRTVRNIKAVSREPGAPRPPETNESPSHIYIVTCHAFWRKSIQNTPTHQWALMMHGLGVSITKVLWSSWTQFALVSKRRDPSLMSFFRTGLGRRTMRTASFDIRTVHPKMKTGHGHEMTWEGIASQIPNLICFSSFETLQLHIFWVPVGLHKRSVWNSMFEQVCCGMLHTVCKENVFCVSYLYMPVQSLLIKITLSDVKVNVCMSAFLAFLFIHSGDHKN